MATTYKLYHAAATDGACYIDLPISGKIAQVQFSIGLTAGAGGIGSVDVELSRVAVNQIGTNNPRGVISVATVRTAAASQGISENLVTCPSEPVKSGERLYVNAGSAANVSAVLIMTTITIA